MYAQCMHQEGSSVPRRRRDSLAAEERIYKWFEDNGYTRIGIYVQSRTPIEVICPKGHKTSLRPNNVFNRGDKCRVCSGKDPKQARNKFNEWVENHAFTLMSDYVNSSTTIEALCSKGHLCKLLPSAPTCKICSGLDSDTVKASFYKSLYDAGYILKGEYKNSSTAVNVFCPKGHLTPILAYNFLKGHGCSICAGNNSSTAENAFRECALKENVDVIGPYVNSNTPIECICPRGHKCFPRPSNAKGRGSWCRICRDRAPSLRAEKLFRDAALRDGVKILGEYTNGATKVRCICPKGHKCSPCPASVLSGQGWCVPCARSAYDRIYLISKEVDEVKWGKIGVAKGTVRLTNHARRGWTVENVYTGLDNYTALNIEKAAIQSIGEHEMLTPEQVPQDGYTETFPYTFMDGIRKIVETGLDNPSNSC